MKVLVFGPSGSGKTYISTVLRQAGYPAFDADEIEGLSSWYDGQGNKVHYPTDAGAEFLDNHRFLWDKDFLGVFLADKPDVYLFGSSRNVFDCFDLFDRIFFLKIEPDLQRERLQHESRENPMGATGFQRENAVAWAMQLERRAKTLGLPFIDASMEPLEILKLLLG